MALYGRDHLQSRVSCEKASVSSPMYSNALYALFTCRAIVRILSM